MAEKNMNSGGSIKYNPPSNEVYCAKCEKWFKSNKLAFQNELPTRCGVCKRKNYWKPRSRAKRK